MGIGNHSKTFAVSILYKEVKNIRIGNILEYFD